MIFVKIGRENIENISHDVDTTLHSGIPYNFPLPSSLAYFDLHVLPLTALFEYIAI